MTRKPVLASPLDPRPPFGHKRSSMGKSDNRRTPKMRRRKSQKKLKTRLKRRQSPLRRDQAQQATPAS